MKKCPQCGSNNNLKTSDSGYSSFNIGTVSCGCGYKYDFNCSCIVEDKDFEQAWNHHIELKEKIKNLSREEMIELLNNTLDEDLKISKDINYSFQKSLNDIPCEVKNNKSPADKVRKLLSENNITSSNITLDNVRVLVSYLNKHLNESGIYDGTAIINELNLSNNDSFKFITMKTSDWDSREAVSFNSDGFIGFCGWADSTNQKPILEAVKEWVKNNKCLSKELYET